MKLFRELFCYVVGGKAKALSRTLWNHQQVAFIEIRRKGSMVRELEDLQYQIVESGNRWGERYKTLSWRGKWSLGNEAVDFLT